MSKENPFSGKPEARVEKRASKLTEQKTNLLKRSKWGGLFAGMMAVVGAANAAEAQQHPREGEFHMDFDWRSVSMAELNQEWTQAMQMLRSTDDLLEADVNRRMVYEGSVEEQIDTVNFRRREPQEEVHLGDTQALRGLEGHVIEISSVRGSVYRTLREGDRAQSSAVNHLGFRVFDVSPAASRRLEATGRHLIEDYEAETADQALALVMEEVGRAGAEEGHVRELYQAREGARVDQLSVNTYLEHSYLSNVHIGEMQQLPNGHFRVHVEADLLREAPPEPVSAPAPTPEPLQW
ncbi:hypothetical protein IPH19_03845 [Candidatus Uhrbacteria bacterium]|nr:MAG: hypothetical protein IPH19_03845 [Candidatus Uhrbacteria bacterium]